MNTTEAIAWVRLLTACLNSPASFRIKEHKENLENCEKADEIVNMLQQGEACRATCKAIKEIFQHNHLSYIDMDLFNELEQKYFPKPTESLKELSELMEIDYEGAWKELKGRYRKRIIKHEGQELQENILWQDIYTENMNNIFRDIERKHTNAQRRIK